MSRKFIFLIAAIIIGVLFIAFSMYLESSDLQGFETVDEEFQNDNEQLEESIETLSKEYYDPSAFVSLRSEIHDSKSNNLITPAQETNLKDDLDRAEKKAIYRRCNSFLLGSNDSSKQLNEYLDGLDKKSNDSTNYYKDQIKAYDYYSKTLPNKVNKFINEVKTCYDESVYNSLVAELKEMPNLNRKYSSMLKFIQIKNAYLQLLDDKMLDWTFNEIFEC